MIKTDPIINFTISFIIFFDEQSQVPDITKEFNREVPYLSSDYSIIERPGKWRLKGPKRANLFLHECIQDFVESSCLLGLKLVNTEGILNLRKVLSVNLEIRSGNTMPSLNVELSVIKFLSRINCEIDIDMYDFR